MISFVWSEKDPFWAGRGGSENYTAGQIRELMRRGIPARVITIGLGEADGREGFPDIQFKAIRSKEELSTLDDTLVFVIRPVDVVTKRQSYVILHCTPQRLDDPVSETALEGKQIIVPSRFAAKEWAKSLRIRNVRNRLPIAYPFAEPCFSKVARPAHHDKKIKIVFAGRMKPDKGIYTLLAALHMDSLKQLSYELTMTATATETYDGRLLHPLLQAHPLIRLIEPRRTPESMARLFAENDIAIMPSTNIFWKELFGIISVEAQHAGCRVVASNSGGLSETDCGGLMLVRPDDPQALANGIVKAAMLGPLTTAERLHAATKFTVSASVDSLLQIIETTEKRKQPAPFLLQKKSALVREQFDNAVTTISQLGRRLARED